MQGPTARQFVVVESGRVHLTQLNPNGNQLILRRAGPVNPFGASTG
jgi:CRP-like cAMP-binding protein